MASGKTLNDTPRRDGLNETCWFCGRNFDRVDGSLDVEVELIKKTLISLPGQYPEKDRFRVMRKFNINKSLGNFYWKPTRVSIPRCSECYMKEVDILKRGLLKGIAIAIVLDFVGSAFLLFVHHDKRLTLPVVGLMIIGTIVSLVVCALIPSLHSETQKKILEFPAVAELLATGWKLNSQA
jgi:hypothetical protein